MKLNALPFHIGATTEALNPKGLPNVYPFQVVFDSHCGMLVQSVSDDLEKVLRDAYAVGQAFGTPLAENNYGKPYAEDFLSFICSVEIKPERGLEIGAGVGYLTRRLLDLGWDMTSLEPGQGYEPFWSKYGIKVIPEFFPSPRVSGPFQLICCYGVLEHVSDALSFLSAIKNHLAPNGKLIISVPDCTEEISIGDPSILFHEHFNYFDAGSLVRLISLSGLKAKVVKSNFGRCLYAVASIESLNTDGCEPGLDISIVANYPQRCQYFIKRITSRLSEMASTGTLGFYCAARGLPWLDQSQDMRFFDDDPALQGRFLPPFQVAIASREDLLAKPVDHLVIISRTFGKRIRDSLRQQGYQGEIFTLEEIEGND